MYLNKHFSVCHEVAKGELKRRGARRKDESVKASCVERREAWSMGGEFKFSRFLWFCLGRSGLA